MPILGNEISDFLLIRHLPFWHPNCATKPKFRMLRLTTYVQRHHKMKRRHACMNTRVLSLYVWWFVRGRNAVTAFISFLFLSHMQKRCELSYIFIEQKLTQNGHRLPPGTAVRLWWAGNCPLVFQSGHSRHNWGLKGVYYNFELEGMLGTKGVLFSRTLKFIWS